MSVFLFYYTTQFSFLPPPFLWSRNVLCSHILCINIFEITSLFYAFILLDSDYQTFTRILNRFSLITKFKEYKQKQSWGFPAFLKLFYWVHSPYSLGISENGSICLYIENISSYFLPFNLFYGVFYNLFTQNLNIFKFYQSSMVLCFTYKCISISVLYMLFCIFLHYYLVTLEFFFIKNGARLKFYFLL